MRNEFDIKPRIAVQSELCVMRVNGDGGWRRWLANAVVSQQSKHIKTIYIDGNV